MSVHVCLDQIFVARKCEYLKTAEERKKASCSDFTTMVIEGYLLDKSESGLDQKTDEQVAAYMQAAMDKGLPLPNCIYKK